MFDLLLNALPVFETVILGVAIVGIIALFLMGNKRRKRDEATYTAMLSEIKVGDRVSTRIGVFGKIKSIIETTVGKVAIIETGNKVKTELEIDFRLISGIDNKDIVVYDENNNIIEVNGKKVEAPEPVIESVVESPKEVTPVVKKKNTK